MSGHFSTLGAALHPAGAPKTCIGSALCQEWSQHGRGAAFRHHRPQPGRRPRPNRGGRACRRSTGGAVTLVAVSKTHPSDAVRAALRAGQRIFGENRVQEALGKFPALRGEFPDLALHLIGPCRQQGQGRSRPLRRDRDRRPAASGGGAGPRDGQDRASSGMLHRGQYGEEPQKAGSCRKPPTASSATAASAAPADRRADVHSAEHEQPALHFALLREIARRNGLDQLSMGMSAISRSRSASLQPTSGSHRDLRRPPGDGGGGGVGFTPCEDRVMSSVRPCADNEHQTILAIVNAAAEAYRG